MKTINIAHLYYDILNLYGENGNVRCLKKKLEEQNIKVKIFKLSLEDSIDFSKYDIFYIGSGSEKSLELVRNDILKYKEQIKKTIESSKLFISTGNSLALFGKTIDEKPALNIFDYQTTTNSNRFIGEVIWESKLIDKKIIGFLNNQIELKNFDGDLFKNGDSFEGINYKNFYSSLLIGPLLIRNPFLTDYIISKYLKLNEIKYSIPSKNIEYTAYEEFLKNFDTNEKNV